MLKLLERRGVSAAELKGFLNPAVADLDDPAGLPGVSEAADLILAFVAEKRPVVVFGDYDCDGISATAILVMVLGKLGGKVTPFLPERLTEGYGMSEASVNRMLHEHPDVKLVITVDNGINSDECVADLKRRGVSVVVTDHHLPGATLPAADVIVNPKVASPAHFADLCGAGVAYLLAYRLVNEAKRRGLYTGQSVGGPPLVLAGLATVTDIMPLLGQNRILVAEALRHFRRHAPTGLSELHQRAARNAGEELTTRDFGFVIGPRINAVGRLDSGMKALALLLESDRDAARVKAVEVDRFNVERKNIEQKMTEEAMAKIVPGAPAQVIDLPEGHPGVAGIVAARVMERLAADPEGLGTVPVCVIAGGHGSARAPEGINIRDAFEACSAVLTRFGGHAAAAGFTVAEGKTDEFRELLCTYCRKTRGTVPMRRSPFDAVELWIEPKDLTLGLAEQLRRLEPFGEGNPQPVFGLRGVRLSDVRPLGNEGRHVQFFFRDRAIPRAVWWNHGELIETLRGKGAAPYDLAFTLEVSDYGGPHPELRLVGLEPVNGCH